MRYERWVVVVTPLGLLDRRPVAVDNALRTLVVVVTPLGLLDRRPVAADNALRTLGGGRYTIGPARPETLSNMINTIMENIVD